jgi:YggT family protein
MHALGNLIDSLVWMYTLIILTAAVLSWIRLPHSPLIERIREVVDGLTRPYLRVFRRFVPPLGGLDIAPMLGLIALQFVGGAAATAVGRI